LVRSPGRRRPTAPATAPGKRIAPASRAVGDASDAWIPDRGDVIWPEFDPRAGRQQAGRRPAVVLSPASYDAPTSRALRVPVSTKAKGYPFEVPLPEGFPVQGVAFADRVKCPDRRARHAQPVSALPADVVASLLAGTRALPD
jgi:mRNA interferase MazF